MVQGRLDRMGRAATRRPLVSLALILGAALALRLLIAVVLMPESGYGNDMWIMTEWARWLAQHGPGGFYVSNAGDFTDYPPAYLYVLWLLGIAGRTLGETLGRPDMTRDLIKVPFFVADIACGLVVYALVLRIRGVGAALVAAAVFVFNPAVIFLSAVWGQNDPVGTLVVLVTVYALVRGWTEAAGAAAVLALMVKFQYGFLIPVVFVVAVMRHLVGRSTSRAGSSGGRDPRRIVTTGLASAAAMLLVGYPFGLVPISAADPAHSLWHRFLAASAAYAGLTVNAFNIWMNPLFDVVHVGGRGITEGRWPGDTATLFAIAGVPVTWQVIGIVAFLAVALVALTVLVRRDDGYAVLFVGLVIAVAFYVLPTRVHERYLYPALALAVPFVVCRGGWRAFYAAITTIYFLGLYWVYTLPMGEGLDRWRLLDSTVLSVPGIYALSLVMVFSLGWLLTRVPRPLALPIGLDFVGPPPPPRRIGIRLVPHRA